MAQGRRPAYPAPPPCGPALLLWQFGRLSFWSNGVLALIAISLSLLRLPEGVVFRCAGPWWHVLRRAAQPCRRESPTMPPDTLVHEPRKVLVISSAIRRAMPGTIPKMMAGMGTWRPQNALGSDYPTAASGGELCLLNRQNQQPHRVNRASLIAPRSAGRYPCDAELLGECGTSRRRRCRTDVR